MRILSQKGQNYFDLPYEKCITWLRGSIVKASPIGEPESDYTLAIYSAEEKALKAMEMLHEAYTGVILMQNVEMSDEDKDQLQNSRGIISVISAEDNVKIEPLNIVWRFPQEDEL